RRGITLEILGPAGAGEFSDHSARELVEQETLELPITAYEEGAAHDGEAAVRADSTLNTAQVRRGQVRKQQSPSLAVVIDRTANIRAHVDGAVAGIPGHTVTNIRPLLRREQLRRSSIRGGGVERVDFDLPHLVSRAGRFTPTGKEVAPVGAIGERAPPVRRKRRDRGAGGGDCFQERGRGCGRACSGG